MSGHSTDILLQKLGLMWKWRRRRKKKKKLIKKTNKVKIIIIIIPVSTCGIYFSRGFINQVTVQTWRCV
jgi:hypothetical protein